MTQQEVELLLKKYRLGLCSDEEKTAIEDWYEKEYNSNKIDWNLLDKAHFKQMLDKSILPEIDAPPVIKLFQRPVFKYGIAAAVIGVVIGSFYLWNHQHSKKDWFNESQVVRFQNDVNPGKAGATLTINNGKSFALAATENNLNNGNVSIARQTSDELIFDSTSKSGKQSFENTISTQNGQQYKVVLSDGTKVWINAASSMHFKMPFDHNKRVIELTGEAYFEVEHNAKKPFIVISNKDTITVLGTHFNINSYNDEPAYVATLLEGKVKYSSAYQLDSSQYTLFPNDVLSRQKQIVHKSNHDDVENNVAWKDGYFSFSDDDIHTVMRQLARWYNIKVNYENANYNEKFYGDLRKDATLTSILAVLEKSGVKFLIQGNTVTVL